MVELTLDDLARWQPGRFQLLNATSSPRETLAVELSWAATISTGTPVLPPVRGGELVIVPRAKLDELSAREGIGWQQILQQLATLTPAGVLTDDTGLNGLPPGLLFLASREALPVDIESRLNREIIERRGEHYQLGSELARELSAASIRGANLEALLALAAAAGGVAIALVAASGAVLGASRPNLLPEGLPFDPERPSIPFLHEGLEWVTHPVQSLALPQGVALAAGIEPEAPADRARLILEQTADSLGMLFDRLPPVEALSPRREIEQLLEQIVVHGNVTPATRRRFAHLAAEAGISGELRLMAELDEGEPTAPGRELRFRHAGLGLSVIAAEQYRAVQGDKRPAVLGPPVDTPEALASQLAAVQRAAELMREEIIAPGVVDLGAPAAGVAAVALLQAGLASGRAGELLRAYAVARLAALDAYDAERSAELVRTLAAYLDHGASVAAAARALGVHRNTLTYRIARIEEVGGLSLADPAARFDLQLAIAIRRALGGPSG